MKQFMLITLFVLALFASESRASKDILREDLAGEDKPVTEFASEREYIAFAEHVKAMVLAHDNEGLKKYMEYGVLGPNARYSREEAFRMMDDSSSWLYKRFFDSSWSLSEFFLKYPDATVDKSGACDYYSLSYESADGKEEYGCNILSFKHGGKFYFWVFQVCPSP